MDAIIAAWTRHHTKHEAMQMIGAAGIPAGAVLDTMELQNDPTFEQRGIMQVMHHQVHGDFKMPAWPVRVNGKPSRVVPSPVLGEHTAEVLQAWLGLSEADVAGLQTRRRAVGGYPLIFRLRGGSRLDLKTTRTASACGDPGRDDQLCRSVSRDGFFARGCPSPRSKGLPWFLLPWRRLRAAFRLQFCRTASSVPAAPAEALSAQPAQVAVVDGGTLRLRDRVVRLLGVDPPARGTVLRVAQDCGAAATNALAAMVQEAPVVCRITGKDGMGRPYADLPGQGTELNSAMIAAGWARADTTEPELQRAEQARACDTAESGPPVASEAPESPCKIGRTS